MWSAPWLVHKAPGPVTRNAVCERTFCSAFPAWVCCLVYSPTGPRQRVTSLTYPTGTLLGSARLTPAGATEWGFPCHGASAVPECPRALPVTAGSDGGSRGRRLQVYAHDPRHAAAAVPCSRGSTFVVPTVTARRRFEWRIRRTAQGTYRTGI
jgi:hypothetical protein